MYGEICKISPLLVSADFLEILRYFHKENFTEHTGLNNIVMICKICNALTWRELGFTRGTL